MATIDNLRNNIIDKLLTISNEDYLSALYQLIEKSSVDNDIVKLTEEQILMLQLSDVDIENNRLISQEQLDKNEFSKEEMLESSTFLQKIDIGIEQSASGQTYTTPQAKEKLKKWLK